VVEGLVEAGLVRVEEVREGEGWVFEEAKG
jgi:hypothetical protein